MSLTTALALWGAALSTLLAADQLVRSARARREKDEAERVDVRLTLDERWSEWPPESGEWEFEPVVKATNYGRRRVWVEVLGVAEDSGHGYDDRLSDTRRALDRDQAVTINVPGELFTTGHTLTPFVELTTGERIEGERFTVGSPPDPPPPPEPGPPAHQPWGSGGPLP